MINWFAAKKSTGAAWGSTCRHCSHSHTHTHSLTHTLTQSYARSLSVALSRSVCCWGQRVFKQVSQVCAVLLLLLSPSSSLCAAVGRDQPPILFTHLLELPLSLLAARCSLLGCAAASSLLVCWCLRRFYRRRSAFHCLNLCALAPALSRSLSLSPSLYLFLSLFVAFAVSLF